MRYVIAFIIGIPIGGFGMFFYEMISGLMEDRNISDKHARMIIDNCDLTTMNAVIYTGDESKVIRIYDCKELRED